MKEKISLSIDVTKLQKERLRTNEFTTKAGENVKQTLADLVVIPLQETKVVKSADTYDLVKVGFVVEKGKKEENTNIVGDALIFKNKEGGVSDSEINDVDSIPF